MSKLGWLTERIKKHRKLLVFVTIVLVVAITGVSVLGRMKQQKEQMQTRMNQPQTSTVEKRTLVSSVSATGTLTSVKTKDVTVGLSGLEVKSVSVEVGDVVEAGQILCELDSSDIEESLQDAKTSLNISNEKTKMDLASAERNLQNAVEDFNTDLERQNADLQDVYDDYVDVLADEAEAKEAWEEAKADTEQRKAEYEHRVDLFEEAKEKLSKVGASNTYTKKFNEVKSEMMTYAATNKVTLNESVVNKITIGSNLNGITADTIISSVGSDKQETGNNSNAVTPQAQSPSEPKKAAETTNLVDTEEQEVVQDNATVVISDSADTNMDDPKEEPKTEEPKNEEPKTEELKTEEPKIEEPQSEEPKEGETTEVTPSGDTQEEEIVVTRLIEEIGMNEEGIKFQMFAGNIIPEAEIKAKLNNYLSELKNINSQYNRALEVESEYNYLQQEVSTSESKYNAAKQEESSAEKAYEQAVSSSESQLKNYEKQQQTLDDTKKSGENSILSKSESLYSSQLNSITSGDSDEDKIKEYREQIADCVVKAPMAGIITAVNIEAGDTYNGSAIVTIDDISAYEVSTEIDEYDIGKIKVGQKVIIKTNATGDEELEGTVKRIAPRASSGGSEVTYTVVVSVETPHEMLRMDMTAKLSIILESKENVLTVPYEAVQEDAKGKYYVEVVSEDSDSTNNVPKPEGTDRENMPQMPEGMDMENKPQRPEGMSGSKSGKWQNKSANSSMENIEIATKKIYVEKGIESDYYIEIISSEIYEGMKILLPSSEGTSGGRDIQNMMMRQGPMGGF